MKAVLCKAFGPPESLVIEEVDPLKPGKGQVVISVKACGELPRYFEHSGKIPIETTISLYTGQRGRRYC